MRKPLLVHTCYMRLVSFLHFALFTMVNQLDKLYSLRLRRFLNEESLNSKNLLLVIFVFYLQKINLELQLVDCVRPIVSFFQLLQVELLHLAGKDILRVFLRQVMLQIDHVVPVMAVSHDLRIVET